MLKIFLSELARGRHQPSALFSSRHLFYLQESTLFSDRKILQNTQMLAAVGYFGFVFFFALNHISLIALNLYLKLWLFLIELNWGHVWEFFTGQVRMSELELFAQENSYLIFVFFSFCCMFCWESCIASFFTAHLIAWKKNQWVCFFFQYAWNLLVVIAEVLLLKCDTSLACFAIFFLKYHL